MSGELVMRAPHLDGSEDIGVWADVAWAVYMRLGVELAEIDHASLDDLYTGLASKSDDGKPTPEEWGASAQAQQGQAAMFAMLGGAGLGPVGDEG